MHSVHLLASGPASIGDIASYGLGGLIFVTMVVPLAIYILRDKERQLAAVRADLERERQEKTALRQSLDEKFVPALQQSSSTLSEVIRLLDSRPRL